METIPEKVDSPNIETKDWLSESTAKGFETVEVELGHLILWAKQNPEIKLVLVQMGTRSKIDHLGIVSIDKDGAYLYEFTNSTGIQKIFISEFWKRSADRLGKVHYVVGEFHNPLSKDEWQLVKEKLDHWALHLDSNPPKNCLETLIQSLATMRAISVKTVNVSHFI